MAGSIGLAVTLAGCGGDSGDSGSNAAATDDANCADYKTYGDLSGKTVSIYAGIVSPEQELNIASYKQFEACTGATIKYEADKTFETQILIRTEAGNPPDIAIVPQPGLLKSLVATGKVKAAPAETEANVDKFWSKDWKTYGTVDGKFYAAPYGASVKSLVWYSPSMFEEKGWKVPTTLAELTTLTDQIASSGVKPWCAGIGSDDATGWPLTDWLEDWVLRLSGPETYDKWVNHEIAFNSPEVTEALDAVGAILKNPKYVNGGLGEVDSIATTRFQDAGLPILEGTCALHRQASFYAANWTEGTEVTPDGDIFAFYLPGQDAATKPVLGAGEFVTAFTDRPEVKAFQTYLASDTWANERVKATPATGGWVTANNGTKVESYKTDIDKLAGGLLVDEAATFRFDGSDQMPAGVGTNAFWKQITDWVTGQSTKDTLDKIEAAWK